MAYNYENDPMVLAVAERMDMLAKDEIYHGILNTPEIPLLYDFYSVEQKYPGLFCREIQEAKTQRQNVNNFIKVFVDIFYRCHSYDYGVSFEDVKLLGSELILELFNEFSSKLRDLNGNFDKVIECVNVWKVMTSEIIKDIYDVIPSAKNAFDELEHTFLLYTGLMPLIDDCYESFIENLEYGPFVSASKIVLYNFWGDVYSYEVSQIRSDVVKNTEELEMTDNTYNKFRFARTVRTILTNSMDSVISTDMYSAHDYSNDLIKLIQNQFSEYTKHLRRKQIVVRETILFAVDYWNTVTSNIIDRETNNQLVRIRLSAYEPGDKVHPKVFKTTALGKQRIDILQTLQQTSMIYLNKICRDYSNKLMNGEFLYEWSGDIEALKIDYVKLWKGMNDKYIYGIGADVLEDAIKCGDLSPLQSHLINSKINSGALITLACQIGKIVRPWLVYASHSLLDTKGNPHTADSILKLKVTSEASQSIFELFYSCTSGITPGSKKKKKS